MVKLQITDKPLERIRAGAAILFMFEGDAAPKAVDARLGGRIAALLKGKKFTAKKGSVRAIDTLGKLPADTILLAGLGKKDECTLETVRRAAASAARAAKTAGAETLALSLEGLAMEFPADDAAQAAAEGILLSQYTFTAYRKKDDNGGAGLKTAFFAPGKEGAKIKAGLGAAEITCRAVYLARDLGNHPGNVATPSFLANAAARACRKAGVKCRVYGRRELEKMKMGSFLAVAKGSAEEPKFIVMEHMKGPKNQKPVVLVGKGLTFDTGGISIKPSGSMEDMKFDMSGGGAVIATMAAVGHLKLKMNIAGLVPCTENMPGGRAVKPGDIARSASGITIEIINTDAEGRLILADALDYAKRYKPRAVVDLATLTGACMVALGSCASGLFGTDEKLVAALKAAGEKTGERCWELPLWEEYDDQIKSTVADVKNVGDRYGGAITAARFLKKFTDYPWAHLDIAGTAYTAKPAAPYQTGGSNGLGPRHLIEFLKNYRK
ncbi:MAG: leucyl aminopeptidase [Nitrospinae bacterium]|nr:leucyl aminopeptidase [Nitrospinota bacterium]